MSEHSTRDLTRRIEQLEQRVHEMEAREAGRVATADGFARATRMMSGRISDAFGLLPATRRR